MSLVYFVLTLFLLLLDCENMCTGPETMTAFVKSPAKNLVICHDRTYTARLAGVLFCLCSSVHCFSLQLLNPFYG